MSRLHNKKVWDNRKKQKASWPRHAPGNYGVVFICARKITVLVRKGHSPPGCLNSRQQVNKASRTTNFHFSPSHSSFIIASYFQRAYRTVATMHSVATPEHSVATVTRNIYTESIMWIWCLHLYLITRAMNRFGIKFLIKIYIKIAGLFTIFLIWVLLQLSLLIIISKQCWP